MCWYVSYYVYIIIQKTYVSLLLHKCREGKYIYYAEGGGNLIFFKGARTPKYSLALKSGF